LKTLRFALAAAVCGVLAAGTGFAQEKPPSTDAPPAKAGSDAPRGDAAGAGAGGATKSGSDTKAGNAGDRAAVQSPAAGAQTIELSKDAGRKGTTTAPATGTPGPQGVVLSHGINLVTPDGGYAGLLRRANRKALIANNAAKRPVNPLAGTANLPLTHPGREGPIARNAVGLVLPGSGAAGAGPHVPAPPPHAGPSGTGPIGTVVVGGAHPPPTPPNAGVSATLHTAGINGTTMGHIASGPGIIGGPAKDRSGINGTTVRPKY
jgi:hypothetical protein